jgi:ATP-dependent DNA ligase I
MDYSRLVETYEELDKTSSRLKKTEIVAKLLWETDIATLPSVTLLAQGRLFPMWSDKEIGIATQLVAKIISSSVGVPLEKVTRKFKEIGDFGIVIDEFVKNKKQATLMRRKLTVEKVFDNLQKLADVVGKGSQERKFSLVTELLSSANPKEARYIIRTVLNDLRVGVAQGVIRDAIAKAFFSDVLWGIDNERLIGAVKDSKGLSFLLERGLLDELVSRGRIDAKAAGRFRSSNKVAEKTLAEIRKVEDEEVWHVKSGLDYVLMIDQETGSRIKADVSSAVEWAWFMRADYGDVAKTAKEGGLAGLRKISLELGKPCYVLLAEKAPSLEDALKTFEHVAIETKYDGMRMQIHKKGEEVWLFTRRLEEVTKQFPDIVKLVKENVKAKTCIIEGETIGINPKNGKPMPFQTLSQRIHRKFDIEKTMKEIPVDVRLFDVVYVDGETFFKKPFSERRKELEKIVRIVPGKFMLAEQLITKDVKKAEEFYKKALQDNQEGVMVKNLDALYHPGRRVVGGWLKVKPVMENLDLVIIGGMWGTGKRAGSLSSFILGCKDTDNGKFFECGMMGTGIKEKEEQGLSFIELTKMLKPLIVKEDCSRVKIKPKVVIEVAYEEIQKSPNYDSGFALRFPRLVRLRGDKSLNEVDTTDRLKELYVQQRGGR